MGATLDKPVTEKETERGGGKLGDGTEYSFGASGMQGWRRSMEDSHIANVNDLGHGLSFFGVFDGHGGVEVSMFCKCLFPLVLEWNLEKLSHGYSPDK